MYSTLFYTNLMFKELIHIFRTYFITFKYFKKTNINFIKILTNSLILIYLLISILN
uniref:Ymf78 n=1 Tax=Tetrahymena rostrata TaxID=5909 RepID=A0A650DE26_TETRO|nr:Ymf78 [Tetrahymena rostrata]QGS65249.1 Ymf78 [Tetrahymena rostrata]URP31106.1 Ymf78 [Tetrahymena rostrata]